jgi:hypothetical protein
LEAVGLLERWKWFYRFGKWKFIFFSMDNPEVKIDRNGWKYYDRLPDNFRLGTMEDFHIKGKKKIGMEYLIQRADQPHFEIHYMTDETRSIKLKPFFDWDMIFVKIK